MLKSFLVPAVLSDATRSVLEMNAAAEKHFPLRSESVVELMRGRYGDDVAAEVDMCIERAVKDGTVCRVRVTKNTYTWEVIPLEGGRVLLLMTHTEEAMKTVEIMDRIGGIMNMLHGYTWDEIVEEVMGTIRDLLDAEVSCYYRVSPHGDRLVNTRETSLPDYVELDESNPIGYALLEQMPVWKANATMGRERFSHMVAIPVYIGDEPYGVLVGARREGHIKKDSIAHAAFLGCLLSLFERYNEKYSELSLVKNAFYEISSFVVKAQRATSREELLDGLYSALHRVFWINKFIVRVREGDELRIIYSKGLSPDYVRRNRVISYREVARYEGLLREGPITFKREYTSDITARRMLAESGSKVLTISGFGERDRLRGYVAVFYDDSHMLPYITPFLLVSTAILSFSDLS